MIYRRGDRYWVQVWQDGKRHRESVRQATGENSLRAARDLERKRLGELGEGTFVGPDEKRLRLDDLRDLLRSDYAEKERKSWDRAAQAWRHLEAYFMGNPRALAITCDRLHQYVALRKAEGDAPATIRNELTALRRAFMVAVERQRLRRGSVPMFPTLQVHNARDVFYSDAEIAAVRHYLPAALKNLWTVAAWTGWRRNELFRLQWGDVDFMTGVIRLNVNTTKNRAGREVPFDGVPELVAALGAQRAHTREVERRTGQIVPHVFHRSGKPIKRMDVARQQACRRAGALAPDGRPKVLHDLRRTAARALTRANVPQHVAMAILGLKTPAMFRRYSILETTDLKEGLAKVVAFRAAREQRPAQALGQ